jgi:ABC-type phosphate/phosphonate transport system substrate-binding protein
MSIDPYRLGAVVYHPKVRQIWEEFGAWFETQALPLDVHYHDTYEEQVDELLAGRIDAAWNTNLAYVQTIERTGGRCRGIAMRDTDRGWTSKLVALHSSGLEHLDDLRGARVGFGDVDSPQAQILPVHALRAQGFDPATDCHAERLDRDVGKHGDTGGAELAQLARVRARELDACVVSSVTLDAVRRLGDAGALKVVWTSPPFHHCNFTVLEGSRADHHRFTALLAAMDATDPRLCEPMELEYVNRWVGMDESGYADLADAVRAGPVVVG